MANCWTGLGGLCANHCSTLLCFAPNLFFCWSCRLVWSIGLKLVYYFWTGIWYQDEDWNQVIYFNITVNQGKMWLWHRTLSSLCISCLKYWLCVGYLSFSVGVWTHGWIKYQIYIFIVNVQTMGIKNNDNNFRNIGKTMKDNMDKNHLKH